MKVLYYILRGISFGFAFMSFIPLVPSMFFDWLSDLVDDKIRKKDFNRYIQQRDRLDVKPDKTEVEKPVDELWNKKPSKRLRDERGRFTKA